MTINNVLIHNFCTEEQHLYAVLTILNVTNDLQEEFQLQLHVRGLTRSVLRSYSKMS